MPNLIEILPPEDKGLLNWHFNTIISDDLAV